jgi:hypothetical protein
MTTSPNKILRDALDIAIDLARAEAASVHETYAGYKPHKHAAVDEDVRTIEAAIAALAAPILPVAGEGELPPLPEPVGFAEFAVKGEFMSCIQSGYTADQMHAHYTTGYQFGHADGYASCERRAAIAQRAPFVAIAAEEDLSVWDWRKAMAKAGPHTPNYESLVEKDIWLGGWHAAVDTAEKLGQRPTSPVTYEAIAAILDGIDRDECESDSGWWPNGVGAAYGKGVLEDIKALFENRSVK